MIIVRKIAYNIIVSSAGKILSTVLALVNIGIITRYLGKAGFGNYATAVAFFSFFGALADLGIYAVATREISRPKADSSKIIGKVFTLRLFCSLLVFLISLIAVNWLPYETEVKKAILISAAAFIFASSYGVLNGIFQKNLAMDKVALSELIGKIIQLLVIFIAYQKKLGFQAVMSSLLFSMIVNFLLVFLWSRRYLRFKLSVDFQYWAAFLKESLPMGISVLVTFIYFKMDTILLSFMKPSADVGIYNVAYKVIENLSFFPGMVAGLILPIMSFNIFQNREKFDEVSNKIFKFFLILIIPLVIGTLYAAEMIIDLIGGKGFEEAGLVLRILIFSLAFIFFSNISNNILLAAGKQKKLMYALSLCALFNLAANILFIPHFSYLACAAISVATELLVVVATFYLVAKHTSYFPKIDKPFGLGVSALFLIMFLHLARQDSLPVMIFGGAAVYFLSLWLSKSISSEEIKSLFLRNKTEMNKSFLTDDSYPTS